MRLFQELGFVVFASAALPAAAATFTVTNTSDSGAGSLREAILAANASPGEDDLIHFDIPGEGVHTIVLASPLPTITEPVRIDGYTQPGASPNTQPVGQGFDTVLTIEIDGTGAESGPCINIESGEDANSSTIIQGLVINRCIDTAIRIGTEVAGASISGNFIGTDPTGSFSPGAQGFCVSNDGLAIFMTVAGNLVSGCAVGISHYGLGTIDVAGNLIGTDATGTSPIPSSIGIDLFGPATIGGSGDSRNVISGNETGIVQSGIDGWIQGNFIGTDVTGTQPLGNTEAGISDGGRTVIKDNVISANGLQGISNSFGDDSVVQGNLVGTDVTGLQPLGNGSDGISVSASGVQIGGTGLGQANVVAYNGDAGIRVASGTGNTIRANSIHDNAGFGIDLVPLGATGNDEGDGDTGANALQNFPVLQSIMAIAAGGGVQVIGRLHSAPSTTYDLDFFSNDACVRFPKDFVEGRTFLGSDAVTTDAFGEGPFQVQLPLGDPGERISMTATDPAGNTSEFSQRLPFTITPASGPSAGGTSVTIAGTDFEDGLTVTIGGQPATGVVVSNFNQISASSPALAAGSLNDVVVTNSQGTTGTLEKGWLADFLDLPPTQQFYGFITKLVTNGIAAGMGGGLYGVDQPTLRQQMAVFILKGKFGLCYTPPPCVGVFSDVPCSSNFAPWIEAMAAEGITGGCGAGIFCPQNPVRRDQMAVFLVKAEHGSAYVPPPCDGDFPDVPCPSQFADWIEQLAAESITAGCGLGNFCPESSATRGQMAVFVSKTFGLP